jgi:phage terminase large subunit GpA-like protein
MAVDTQPNRLELQVEAWGPDLEHWVVDHQVLHGSPTDPPDTPGSVWQRLDAYRREPFPHASGVLIPISAYAIDSGGANTQDVYNYGQARAQRGCLIVHGSSRPNRPIISNVPSKVTIDWHGKRTEDGALLWTIGTDVAKDHLHNRWKLQHGGGAMHFHDKLQLEWFEQLVAERPMLKRKPGGGFRRVWEKASHGDRNEALDLTVYNLAVAYHLGLPKWSAHDWARLRQRLVPKQLTPDLFTAPAQPVVNDTLRDQEAPAAPAAVAAPSAAPTVQNPSPAAPAVQTSAPAAGGRRVLNRGLR